MHQAEILLVGRFMAAIPISTVIGAPLSGWILGLDGVWGLAGWQWLFIVEGVPTVLLGLVVMFYLTDGPEKADWLAADERDWLIDRLQRERMVREAHGRHSLWEALRHPRGLVLGLVYFRHRGGRLWTRLLAADDRQGIWRHRSSDRFHHGDTLRCRRRCRCDLAASFRPDA